MSNSPISQAPKMKLASAGRWIVACLGTGLLAVSMGHAQATTVSASPTKIITEIRSAYFLFDDDDTPYVMVSDVGTATALSSVRVELRDSGGGLVASATGSVGPGRPLLLKHQFKAGTGLQPLSAIVRITSFADAGNAVMTVFEHIGPDSILARNIVCGPGTTGGGGNAMCLGWYISSSAASPQ